MRWKSTQEECEVAHTSLVNIADFMLRSVSFKTSLEWFLLSYDSAVKGIFLPESPLSFEIWQQSASSKSNFTLNCIPFNPCRKIVAQNAISENLSSKILGKFSSALSTSSDRLKHVNYAESFIVEGWSSSVQLAEFQALLKITFGRSKLNWKLILIMLFIQSSLITLSNLHLLIIKHSTLVNFQSRLLHACHAHANLVRFENTSENTAKFSTKFSQYSACAR